jgi:hypothetical protein
MIIVLTKEGVLDPNDLCERALNDLRNSPPSANFPSQPATKC